MTDHRSRPVVVVGAALAGVHAALGLRTAGYTGRLVIVGAEPHPPYDRPELSKHLPEGPGKPVPAAAGLDVEWLLGRRATALDPAGRTVRLDDDTELPYAGLVIATGVAPMLPPFARHGSVHVLRTLDDAHALRRVLDAGARRVVVVGAGFIGAEVAAACRSRGLDVTLVDQLDLPLLRTCGPLVGEVVARLHRDNGVHLELKTSVVAVEPDPGGGHVVTLAGGRRLPADLVVVGVGSRPATGWLEGSGLDLRDGVGCDATCRAAPAIVAAGDVCRWPSQTFGRPLRVEHWTNAIEQGEYAGQRLHAELRGDPPPPAYDPVPYLWSEQYGHTLQVLGCPEPGDAIEVVAGDPAARRFVAVHVRDGVVRAVVGMDWPARVRRLRSLLTDRSPWPADRTEELTWASR